jgi:hypothetical protein
MDDEPQVEQLENRIDSLESTIEKMMPSRRDALKMGGAALAGGSLMAGTASADTVNEQVGTIGGPGQEVDLVSEDIDNSNQINTKDLSAQSVDSDILSIGPKTFAKHVETKSPASGQVQFSGLDLNRKFAIRMNMSGPNDVEMTFDNNSTSGNYHYWDETGVRKENQNVITVVRASSFHRAGGDIIIGSGDQAFPGFTNEMVMARPNAISGFAQKGGGDSIASSVEIDIGGSDYTSDVTLFDLGR